MKLHIELQRSNVIDTVERQTEFYGAAISYRLPQARPTYKSVYHTPAGLARPLTARNRSVY